ncbi:ABC transporter substrate-binding protein [Desulfovibrio sp. OttesenSCG-928-M16]|nr:ABC transporter substrate-binding protein [Desulfovibrio sp. OttesenSCG-928-M16]
MLHFVFTLLCPSQIVSRAILLFLAVCLTLSARASFGSAPESRVDARPPLRVIYVEGGEYEYYTGSLHGIFAGLQSAGIIRTLPESTVEDTRLIWRQAAALSPEHIRFLPDGYYSAGWDPDQRRRNKEAILTRIREKGDVDLILAMGTWAGVDMATDEHQTPVVVLATSDAYSAGIIKKTTESGRPHVYAVVAPDWLPRQIVFFHKLFRFKRLGLTYDDSEDGRNAVGLNLLVHLSSILDFELVSCADKFDIPDLEASYTRLLACHEKLAKETDAMYVTASSALLPQYIPSLVAPFAERGIPTFAQSTPEGVREGILLDIAQSAPESEGRFVAAAIVQILQGVRPDQAQHLFEGDITISLNMDTARKIGWAPPFSLLQALDTLYMDQQARRYRK